MADLEKTVQIIFSGDDQIGQTISNVGSGIDRFSGSVVRATQPLANMTDMILKLDAALAAVVVGSLAYAVSKSIEFESATVELQKVLGDNVGVLDEARERALDLSNQYGESASDVLMSTADFKQAGFDVKGAFELTKSAMDLVIAGSLSAAEASEILVRILKGFKEEADESTRIVDILNEVSNNYAVSVTQLGTGMARISPIARQMGFSFEEIAGVLTPVIEVFQSGDEAANALKTGLLRLIDDNPAIVAALQSIGVSQRDQNGALRSGKDILADVALAFTRLDENQKLFVTSQIVGINQAAKMVEVFNSLSISSEVTATAMNAAGSAALEVKARLESGEVAINRFREGFTNLAIVVGDQFREAAKEAIDGGTAIENALEDAVSAGAFAPLFNMIETFTSELGRDLDLIANMLPEALSKIDWQDFLNSLGSLGNEIVEILEMAFGEFPTTPEELTRIIQAVIEGFTRLIQVTEGIVEGLRPFIEKVVEFSREILSADADTANLAGQILGLGRGLNETFRLVGNLGGAIQSLGTAFSVMAVGNILTSITNLGRLTTALGGATAALTTLGGYAALFGGAWTLGTIFRENIPLVDQWAESFQNSVLAISGLDRATIDAIVSQSQHTEAMGLQAKAIVKVKEALGELPSQKATEVFVKGSDEYNAELERMLERVQAVPVEHDVNIRPQAVDIQQFVSEWRRIYEVIPDPETGEDIRVLVATVPNTQSIQNTKSELDRELPTERIQEIRLQGEIDVELATIQAQAEVIQSAFEWQARLEIAEVEAAARRLETLARTTSEMFTDTGDTLLGAMSILAQPLGISEWLTITRMIEKESRRRDELLKLQGEMISAEIEWTKAKTAAMKRGEGMITINVDGVYPELDLVMTKIVERAQVRGNAEGLEYLLGI